jgi:hypothetical protein
MKVNVDNTITIKENPTIIEMDLKNFIHFSNPIFWRWKGLPKVFLIE